jgi:hypothetical protein
MSQIELRVFNPELDEDRRLVGQIGEFAMDVVFRVHYPSDVPGREVGEDGRLILNPEDITLIVPRLYLPESKSYGDYELELTQGSGAWSNWLHVARRSGSLMPHFVTAKQDMQRRSGAISSAMAEEFPTLRHCVLDATGRATGFTTYQP